LCEAAAEETLVEMPAAELPAAEQPAVTPTTYHVMLYKSRNIAAVRVKNGKQLLQAETLANSQFCRIGYTSLSVCLEAQPVAYGHTRRWRFLVQRWSRTLR
jgi:hypothetical protein